ncbi:MAG: hypothetical protein Q8O68_01500 [Candidatus Daviesbacteria bacterium]|nr:hypothetical protein [Candidatus Daviesbacteria bacterium]
MSPEKARVLRQDCLAEIPDLIDEGLGIKASGGSQDRFRNTHYGRDAYISIIMGLSEPQNGSLQLLLRAAIQTQRLAASLQGREFNSATEEAPGKKPHEFHNGNSPQLRLLEMRKRGWPVYELGDGRLGMLYYGSGDATPLFNISVAVVYRAIASKDKLDAKAYLREMWSYVNDGLNHDIQFGDLDGDGLIESNPQNTNALLNHTWKDSNDAYRDERGRIPKPPYKYLTNNAYFLWSLREGIFMAEEMGDKIWAKELEDRYKRGKERLHSLFWMPDLAYYAPLIAGRGQQVKFIGDDPVIALWAGVIDPEYAQLVINRLKLPDMNTNWGLRTRSSQSSQSRVNGSRSYHNGAVWLHETLIAAKAVESMGDYDFAEELDNKAVEFQKKLRRSELAAVEKRRDRLLQYRENGIVVACRPQAWGTWGTLGRTAKVA